MSVPSVVSTFVAFAVCVGSRLFNAPFAVVEPVPPLLIDIVVPFHTPVVIVPILLSDDNVVTPVFTSVPVVGRVTFVLAVVVKVRGNAPDVVRLSPSVIVFPVFATPVPPRSPVIIPQIGRASCRERVSQRV